MLAPLRLALIHLPPFSEKQRPRPYKHGTPFVKLSLHTTQSSHRHTVLFNVINCIYLYIHIDLNIDLNIASILFHTVHGMPLSL